jgi:lysyl-tRNA synthetase, class II
VTPPEPDLPEQMRVRREKLARLTEAGVEAYAAGFPRTRTLTELREAHAGLPPDSATGERVGITGRVVFKRDTGRLAFAALQEGADGENVRLQVMLAEDALGAAALAAWKRDVDLGDLVGVEGEVVTSRRGELSVRAERWAMTAKALRPLPTLHKPMSDEERVRARYVDLLVRPEARAMLHTRAEVLWALRTALRDRGYVEVETPVLQTVHGGASARPFSTRSNALDLDLSLRIALELHLKRLVVGGVDRVFEMGKNFRNEGVDSTHNPEFTMLEAYQAYGDYDSMAALARDLVLAAARAAGSTVVPDNAGGELDLEAPWRTVTLHAAVSEAVGEELTPDTPEEQLRRVAGARGVELQPSWSAAEVLLELYEQLVEPFLREPTFVRDYPVEVRPLARPCRHDPRLAQAWDLVALGRELAPAYSELVDPVEQRRRLTEHSLKAAGGDAEAMALDEDFLRALEHGMPPTGGMGMGIDRLLMLLTGTTSIRETVLFPLVRPH